MLDRFSPNLRGMIALTLSTILFTFSDALAKLASQHWPVAQVLAIRSVVAIALMVAVLRFTGEMRRLATLRRPMLVLRSVVEAALALTVVSALAIMPLADITTILMLAPAAITAIANLFLGEDVGWRRWSAIAVGFLGMLLVVQPGAAVSAAPGYMLGVILGLVSVVGIAARDILTRRISDDVPTTIITVGTLLATLAGSLLLSLFFPWRPLAPLPFVQVALAAVIVTAGNFFVIVACRGVDLSVVAPYRYSAVIWSIAAGYLIFGDLPNRLALAGMAIVAASGVYLMHRGRVRRGEARRSGR